MSSGKITSVSFYSTGVATPVPSIIVAGSFKSRSYSVEQTADGTHLVKNFRIFKVGTFKDSLGFERSYDSTHLDQMVAHYAILKDGNYFPNVPIRADHSDSILNVVGYFRNVYRDPTDTNFLSSDIEFTEPDAFAKFDRGTWRSRSLEVGMYETNDGKSFFPTVLGMAFVDIPGVEGLYGRQGRAHFAQVIAEQEEPTVPPETKPDPTITPPPTAPPPAPPPAPPVAPAPAPEPSPAPAPVAPTGQPSLFKMNGQDTNDYARVQAHITSLEAFRQETVVATRKEFVEGLAKANKIAAPQIETLQAFALSLSDEQFVAFQKGYETAVPIGTFSAGQETGDPLPNPDPNAPAGPGNQPKADELTIATEVVQQFRRIGKPEDFIKKTPAYRTLAAAGKAPF